MELLLGLLTVFLIAGGVIFSVLPPLPGPLISYAALLTFRFLSETTAFSRTDMIVWGAAGLLIVAADYLLPIVATKKFGGTKYGIIGGVLGTIAGVLLPIPLGIITGSLLGAIIGDLYGGNRIKAAFKSGLGSFVGFLAATGLKLLYSMILGGVIAWKAGSFAIGYLSDFL